MSLSLPSSFLLGRDYKYIHLTEINKSWLQGVLSCSKLTLCQALAFSDPRLDEISFHYVTSHLEHKPI